MLKERVLSEKTNSSALLLGYCCSSILSPFDLGSYYNPDNCSFTISVGQCPHYLHSSSRARERVDTISLVFGEQRRKHRLLLVQSALSSALPSLFLYCCPEECIFYWIIIIYLLLPRLLSVSTINKFEFVPPFLLNNCRCSSFRRFAN